MGDTEIEKILEDLDDIHKRMEKWIEDQKDQPNKVVPPFIDPIPFAPLVPNPIISKCGKCGLEMSQVMGYVCSDPMCPTGLGPTMCNSTGQEGHSALTTLPIGKPIC